MKGYCACGVADMAVKPDPGSKDKGPNLFLPRKADVLRAEQTTPYEKHFTLRLADQSQLEFQPGQILEVGLMGFGEIPIGLASSPTRKNTFDIVVRSVGRVSTAVNKLEAGDSLLVRGPLGNGFDLDKLRGRDILIVAGGIGLCPTRSLIQYILDRRKEFKRFILMYGTREPKMQLFLDDLAEWRKSKDIELHETVDRADPTWAGNVGVVTKLFNKVPIDPETRVVVCGPPIMFRYVISVLDSLWIPRENIYVDLERRMKCGVGKCGHCQINDKYVCVDGPVFSFAEVENLEEAP
ncbi:MAG: FAD/NAD(P)-binding protein [Elusimicrobia bacterium]|nr:FAD/NAD(P)-binding protein [Elusimicrobiota bacterium]